MNRLLRTILSAAALGFAAPLAHASVVVSNLDPANTEFGFNAPEIGQGLLTGNRPVSLTSVEFEQTSGLASGETFSVYSRNTNGTVGAALFTNFALAYDPTTTYTTATAIGSFTLQAGMGYYFVLSSGSTSNVEWSYTSSTDYASAFGATLPTTDTSFDTVGSSTAYYNLSDGPQSIQVNGLAGAVVPEPSTWAIAGLALSAGVVALRRRGLTNAL